MALIMNASRRSSSSSTHAAAAGETMGVEQELSQTELRTYLEEKLAFFRSEGYAVLEQALSADLLDELNAAYQPLMSNIRERDRATAERFIVPEGADIGGETLTLVSENGVETEVAIPPEAVAGSVLEVATSKDDGGGGGHRGHILEGNGLMVGNERYHLNVPFVAPFATPDIYENPLVMAFMDLLWEGEDPALTVFYFNGPAPGSTFQKWHRDSGTDFYDLPAYLERQNGDPFAIGVNIPLVDRTEINGATGASSSLGSCCCGIAAGSLNQLRGVGLIKSLPLSATRAVSKHMSHTRSSSTHY